MRILAILLLVFILLPLVELALLLWLGAHTRWWIPLVLVIVTGAAGASLARLQGLRTYWRIQDDLAAGRLPGDALLDAALIFVAGALLLTPGMLTDALGFSLLLPPSRHLYKFAILRWLKSRFQIQAWSGPAANPSTDRDEIIDSHVVGRPETPPPQRTEGGTPS